MIAYSRVINRRGQEKEANPGEVEFKTENPTYWEIDEPLTLNP
jgi:hypothetical protein